jgi:hypothetical protein
MAAPKYIKRDTSTGQLKEVIATETAAAESIVSTTAGGTIDPTILHDEPVTTFVAGENVAAGAMVYIKSDGKVWNASAASGGNQAQGWVNDAFTTGQTATVYLGNGRNTGVAGLSVGSRYYLSTSSAGGVQSAVPTGAGNLAQFIGNASATGELDVILEDGIILAS